MKMSCGYYGVPVSLPLVHAILRSVFPASGGEEQAAKCEEADRGGFGSGGDKRKVGDGLIAGCAAGGAGEADEGGGAGFVLDVGGAGEGIGVEGGEIEEGFGEGEGIAVVGDGDLDG